MRFGGRLRAFIATGAALLPMAAHAQTENRYDPYGSRGDAGTDLRCDPASYVVGMAGASGSNIDRIQLVCARLGPDGFALPATESSAVIGGPGGGATSDACSAGTYVNKVNVWLTTSKDQVYFVVGYCTPRRGGGPSLLHFGAPWQPADGLFNPYPTREYSCPPNMAVTGLTLRYGKHVNAVGVICSTIVLQPAPPPPPPPRPPGVIIHTGKPKDGSPPPIIKYPSLVGRYNLVSRSGNKLVLVVQEGDANDLLGTLTSADPRYNGAMTGVALSGRKFTFTYKDAATGRTGSGRMTYNGIEGDSIIGFVKTDGPPAFEEVWGGKRQ
jgi:hypothetical protein